MDAAVRRVAAKKLSKTPDIAQALAKPSDTWATDDASCDDHGIGDGNPTVEPEPAECTKRLRDNAWREKDLPGAKRARAVARMSSFVERHYKDKGIPWPIRPPPRESVEAVEDERPYHGGVMNEQVDANKDVEEHGDTSSPISCKTRPMPFRVVMGKTCGGNMTQIPADARSVGARSSGYGRVGFCSSSIITGSGDVELYSRVQQQQQHQAQGRGFDSVSLA